jgi:hypothetical protein
MLYRLCLAVGCYHPDHLKRKLTSHQIADWLAYSEIEPFGMAYQELLHGVAVSNIVNSNGAKPPTRAKDFMPSHDWMMSAEEIFATLSGIR